MLVGVLLIVKVSCIFQGMSVGLNHFSNLSFFLFDGMVGGMYMNCQTSTTVSMMDCPFVFWQSGFQGMSRLSYVRFTMFTRNLMKSAFNIMALQFTFNSL